MLFTGDHDETRRILQKFIAAESVLCKMTGTLSGTKGNA
jgi:hypothetical protein